MARLLEFHLLALEAEAAQGSIEAARRLSAEALQYIRKGEPLPKPLSWWLAAGLEAAADGGSADKALHLAHDAHRPKERALDARNARITERMIILTREHGMKPLAARRQVAQELHVSEYTVRDVWRASGHNPDLPSPNGPKVLVSIPDPDD